MSTNLEIEVKSILTSDEYNKLITIFGLDKSYFQINYYLDTNDLKIYSQKCGLRIRQKGEDFELTLKVPAEEGKTEINQQISDKMFENLVIHNVFPKGEIENYLSQKMGIKIEDIHILGNLNTVRLDIEYKTALISIDKSIYNSITDYEVEAEDISLEKANEHLLEFLTIYDIKYKKSQLGKLDRFLKTFKN